MWTDVVDLRDFYASGLGQTARRLIERRIQAIWPDARGLNLLAIGYGTPYISSFRASAARVLAAMPAQQGVLRWPAEGGALTALVNENELPFPDMSMDRVLIVHSLECAGHAQHMLREVWRVLAGSGRLLAITPNRRGLWARVERTPFGHGQPYTHEQLTRKLRDNMFTPLDAHSALFIPPAHSRMILTSADAFEEIGQRCFSAFAGVVMVEAAKQIYAGRTEAAPARRRAYAPLVSRFGNSQYLKSDF